MMEYDALHRALDRAAPTKAQEEAMLARLLGEEKEKRTMQKKKRPKRAAVAALLALCVLAGALLLPSGGVAVAAYAYGTDEAITAAGAAISTGMIRDSGEMTGQPLQFYLAGEKIERVRFSCKNAYLSFTDWTEQRAGYAHEQNFTVPYGENAAEYYYLVIEWTPTALIRALTDNAESTVATLPEELKNDVIVMEITFADGSTDTKAITIALREDGQFTAAFDDYTVTEEDAFVHRPDAQPAGMYADGGVSEDFGCVSDGTETAQTEDAALRAAEEAALAYYDETVFTVEALTLLRAEGNEAVYSVLVRKGNALQDPARTITLQYEDGEWRVVNEGY